MLVHHHMTTNRRYRILAAAIFFCIFAVAIVFLSSFRFDPDPSGDAGFIGRARKQKSTSGIKVNASARSARVESQRSFGEKSCKI